MVVMTSKRKASDELRRIDDAIDESILGASPEELREELAAQGLDPDKVMAEMDSSTERAKIAGAKMRLAQAKDAVKSFKAGKVETSQIDRPALHSNLQHMRSGRTGNHSGMMMAARKGKQLSQSDEEGTLDDLATLRALEAQEPEASEE
jgi:hypothetical protein